MKRFLIFILSGSCLFPAFSATAQYYFYNDTYYASDITLEAGLSAGVMNSLTDLGGRKGRGKKFIKDLNWKVTKPATSFYLAAVYRDMIGIRLETTIGTIRSYDGLLQKTEPDLTQRYGRNLSFQSAITDWQLGIEIHPLSFNSHPDKTVAPLSPYLISGLGYYSFRPQTTLNGMLYDLHSLRLEGQGFPEYPDRKPYRLHQFNIPAGIGLKYEAGALLNLRLEIVHRFLFTDYLDDVSISYIDPALFSKYLLPGQAAIAKLLHSRMQELQAGYLVSDGMDRGDHRDNDAFFTIQLKAGWVFRKRR